MLKTKKYVAHDETNDCALEFQFLRRQSLCALQALREPMCFRGRPLEHRHDPNRLKLQPHDHCARIIQGYKLAHPHQEERSRWNIERRF